MTRIESHSPNCYKVGGPYPCTCYNPPASSGEQPPTPPTLRQIMARSFQAGADWGRLAPTRAAHVQTVIEASYAFADEQRVADPRAPTAPPEPTPECKVYVMDGAAHCFTHRQTWHVGQERPSATCFDGLEWQGEELHPTAAPPETPSMERRCVKCGKVAQSMVLNGTVAGWACTPECSATPASSTTSSVPSETDVEALLTSAKGYMVGSDVRDRLPEELWAVHAALHEYIATGHGDLFAAKNDLWLLMKFAALAAAPELVRSLATALREARDAAHRRQLLAEQINDEAERLMRELEESRVALQRAEAERDEARKALELNLAENVRLTAALAARA